jgi:hypothetical protein
MKEYVITTSEQIAVSYREEKTSRTISEIRDLFNNDESTIVIQLCNLVDKLSCQIEAQSCNREDELDTINVSKIKKNNDEIEGIRLTEDERVAINRASAMLCTSHKDVSSTLFMLLRRIEEKSNL